MQIQASSASIPSALNTPPASNHPAIEIPQHRRRVSGVSRRPGLTVSPLSTIPNVYSEAEFHLENPRIFDIVSERSEIVQPTGPNGSPVAPGSSEKKALATNAILQEKLSWYMDTVEIHLISSISIASTSFFAALGSLRELHSEAVESVAKIKTLRADLAKVDQTMATGGLKIVAMRRRRANMRKLGDAVKQLQEVADAVGICENQVQENDIEAALKGLTKVELLIAGESDGSGKTDKMENSLEPTRNLVDLRGINALDGAGNDIALLRRRIGKAFESKFIETLIRDIRQHVDNVPASSTFSRWDRASNRSRGNHTRTPSDLPAYMRVDGALRSALYTQLKGLARSEAIMPAAVAYREAVLREFKNLIRNRLPSSTDDDIESTTSIATQESRSMSQQEKSSILARNLRALEAEDADEMYRKIYSNIGEALRRLGMQVKVLLDITSSLGNPHSNISIRSPPQTPQLAGIRSPPHTPQLKSMDSFLAAEPSPGPPPNMVRQEEIQQVLDLSSLLGQAVDIAQSQIIKVLKVRTEQSTRLTLRQFLQYFTLNKLFADECEAVSGRGGTALKTIVNDHIKAFVGYVADTSMQRLVESMDADRWDAKYFTEGDAERLARITESSAHDVGLWVKDCQMGADESLNGGQVSNSVATNGTSTPRDKVRSAVIDEQKYILPESALVVANGIEAFEHLLTGIPSMAPEISTFLLDYLKLFNSRSSQLILGAGATRSAGLKNITTKHLALSSQALSFVIAIIPYVREFVRRHSSNFGSLSIEFDKVNRLYQEHQSGIHDKLVDIMAGRAAAHVSSMKKTDWDLPPPDQQPGVSSYMETLIKETATLHRVLSKHLPETTVQVIMLPVIDSYKEQWGKAFAEVDIQTLRGKERYERKINCISLPAVGENPANVRP